MGAIDTLRAWVGDAKSQQALKDVETLLQAAEATLWGERKARHDNLDALAAAVRDMRGDTSSAQRNACPCGYPGDEPCHGCPDGCKRRPAGVTGWDHIDNRRDMRGDTA